MRDQTVQEGVKAWRTGHITSRRNEGKKRQEPCGKSLRQKPVDAASELL